jgi:hypothetical protein
VREGSAQLISSFYTVAAHRASQPIIQSLARSIVSAKGMYKHHTEQSPACCDAGDARRSGRRRDGDRGILSIVSLSRVFIFVAVVCGVALVAVVASASQHRSLEVKHEFQRQHPCPSTGRTTGACSGYVRDHIVALACGGPDSVANLQWQTIRDARAKDAWERKSCGR